MNILPSRFFSDFARRRRMLSRSLMLLKAFSTISFMRYRCSAVNSLKHTPSIYRISIGAFIVKNVSFRHYPTITPLSLHCLHTPYFLYAISMTFSLCFSSPLNKNDRQRWRFFFAFAVSLPCIIVELPLFPCPCGCKQFRRR